MNLNAVTASSLGQKSARQLFKLNHYLTIVKKKWLCILLSATKMSLVSIAVSSMCIGLIIMSGYKDKLKFYKNKISSVLQCE